MPIHLEQQDCNPHCLKYLWSVLNNQEFVRCVAQLALGQHRHVLSVIRTLGPSQASDVYKEEVNDLIRILRQTAPGQVENRDGWLFQLVSWIALAIRMNDSSWIDPPHQMPSQKGFDGLCVCLSDTKDKLNYLFITEDKATTSPRDVFRDEVLPAIRRIESGALTSQIRSRASVLVGLAKSDEKDREQILQAALWQSLLRFRTCFATQPGCLPKGIELFDGYADAVPGVIERRNGELLLVKDLRKWFQALARKTISELQKMKQI
jgi:hypothetical protein